MKFPKKTKRYCPYCKKHTEHKVGIVSPIIKRGALKKFSIQRAQRRGSGVGMGNLGKWGSKPAIGKWKRKTKATKKIVLIYTCQVCKKSKLARYGRRSSRGQLKEEK
ncbi:MAG: 50S ribosomal protein L44e [Candidatus Pacearchaeota archaeon]